MVWPLTLAAWAMMGKADEAQGPMRRDLVRVIRRGEREDP
jgi:hypothetical protein